MTNKKTAGALLWQKVILWAQLADAYNARTHTHTQFRYHKVCVCVCVHVCVYTQSTPTYGVHTHTRAPQLPKLDRLKILKLINTEAESLAVVSHLDVPPTVRETGRGQGAKEEGRKLLRPWPHRAQVWAVAVVVAPQAAGGEGEGCDDEGAGLSVPLLRVSLPKLASVAWFTAALSLSLCVTVLCACVYSPPRLSWLAQLTGLPGTEDAVCIIEIIPLFSCSVLVPYWLPIIL